MRYNLSRRVEKDNRSLIKNAIITDNEKKNL